MGQWDSLSPDPIFAVPILKSRRTLRIVWCSTFNEFQKKTTEKKHKKETESESVCVCEREYEDYEECKQTETNVLFLQNFNLNLYM